MEATMEETEQSDNKKGRLSVALCDEDWEGIEEYIRRNSGTKVGVVKSAVRMFLIQAAEEGKVKKWQIPEQEVLMFIKARNLPVHNHPVRARVQRECGLTRKWEGLSKHGRKTTQTTG